jgi:hypothetical protein
MASFPKVEAWNYSFVMATSNFRYAIEIESLFAAFAGSSEERPFYRPHVFGALCTAFGDGPGLGAIMTEATPAYSLTVLAALLVIVLLRCAHGFRNSGRRVVGVLI